MRKFKKLLILTLGIILLLTIVSYSEEIENYFTKINQQGIDSLYGRGNQIQEIIEQVKEGEKSGKDALSDYIMSSDSLQSSLYYLSKLVKIDPPNEGVKSLKNVPEGGTVNLKAGAKWKHFHQKIIQSVTYYVTAQWITNMALTNFDLKQLQSSERLIELGNKAQEEALSMVRFVESEEDQQKP